MEGNGTLTGSDVSSLFGELLVPLPHESDVYEATFVVNRHAGRRLCCLLRGTSFFTLAGDVQLRIVSFLDVGLSAGHCSAVRLRLSCEGCQLIELLVELLKGLTARGEGDGGSSTAQHDSELIEVVGRVLGMVCSAGIGVYELKRVLRELRVPSALTPPLVGALTLMAGRNESLARMQSSGNREETADPYCCEIMESMFDFGGDGAGLVLPVALWPFPQEYQLVAWVRVDQSAASPADGAKVRGAATRAHLVTFTTEKGAGVDYYIKDSRLFVDVADGGGGGPIHPTVVDMGAAGLISGRWHALVISHRRSSKLLFNKDHLEVFVDGKLSFSASVPYPRRISEPLARCSIGSNLDGQTSGVVLLSGVASLKITKSMLNRLAGRLDDVAEGADTFGNSSPDLDLWDDKATVSAQQRLKRTLLGSKYHIFAALLPNRTVDDLCLEPHNGHHGLLRRGTTHVWITHTVQDVIRSIGGTPSLLSLANGLLSEAPGVSLGRRKNNSFIGQSVDIVLSVLLSFLDGNVANQGDFFFAGGVEILQVLLRSAPKMRFSSAGTHTVMVLERIFQTCRSDRLSAYIQQALPGLTEDAYRPEAGVSSLPHQILLCLLANFPLWARAPPEFQFGLVTSVLDVARDEPELCRQSLPLERVLVSVRVCCPDQIPGEAGQSLGGERTGVSGFMSSETTSESSADLSGTTSTDADWTIMARRERLHMRGFLWELVRLLLGREVGKQDGEAIVHFLASCDDTRLVCELVQVLGSLMRKPVPPSGLFWALESASCVDRGVASRRRGPRTGRPLVHAGFLSLVLERSVLVTGASEDLRVAGLRVANVFMARSAKANEREAVAAGGESMDSKVFPLLSEGLVRDRHILGEATYAALLEMALLGDERDLPWAEQDSVVGVVEANYRFKRHNNSDLGSQEGRRSEETSTEDEDLTAGVWWDCGSQDVDARGGTGHVLDDAQLIRNVLPLALILQYLPTMASSVQVRSHGDLLLMLKLNEANRQKVMELSHVHDGKFWGIWERCMFLMMAPLFSRGVSGHTAELDSRDGISQDGERKGDYFMVLRLYAILLEHAMSFDEDGYKEIAVAASLQHLIPHGRVAVRVLLAQLAFEVRQNLEPFIKSEPLSDACSDDPGPEREQEVGGARQRRWDNMIHLAFIAANIVSDDVSTVTLGLFPEGEGAGSGRGLPRDGPYSADDNEAIKASAASVSIPLLLCSNPAGHASLALSARVLGMFGVLSGGASSALVELCAARSVVSGQGPLMFPLLRLSVFLLVHLHPFTKPARENLERFTLLVHCLLSDDWCLKEEIHVEHSDNMCIVVLAHVHAALLRLKVLATTVGGTSYGLISEARKAVAGEKFTNSSVHPLAADATAACEYGRALVGLLRRIALSRQDLLSTTLGERLVGALQNATTFEPQHAFGAPDRVGAADVLEQHADQARRCWDHLLQSLKWMEGSFLFSSPEQTAMRANNGVAALLEACMPSLKAAEEMESQAVREAGERTRRWRELANRTAPGSDVTVLSADEKANKVLETIQQEALNAEASRKIKTGCRLLASRRRLQCYLRTLCAAWSPWAAGNNSNGGHEPRGWEVSSHKDQLMRQMLLVPVDTDVGHADEAYAGTTRRPGDGDAHRDPAMISGVQPSRSLLAGVDFIFDDDEVTDGEVDNDQSSSAAESFGHAGATAEPAEWEHIPPPGALQVESVVSVQSTASQQEQEHVTTTATGGSASSQRVFGRWRATNVLRQGSVPGILYLFEESLVFEGERNEIEDSDEAAAAGPLAGQTWRWRLGRLTQVHLRRFLLRPQAIELFWADSPEVFLAFEDVTARQTFTRHLRKRNVPMLPVITRQGILHPRKVLKACRLTESWRRRQISNFQYIMALNVIAGRSFNDISQYPVFPWVLADYSSSELDLNNPSSFRDLSRPMGALNEQRRRLFVERYASFEDEMVPKFMYGTHYSSAGVVLHYLVRQDPFTSLHVNLQGGRFDCPDRLFYDMGQSWKACADGNSMSDVKELTPEFFYSPEIFLNSNKLPLGEMQGERGSVDDVRLPPWAKDAFDFVRIHRLALESEHVSKHLHRWIDLIFGYQQRGDEAVKAANVFYYLTYEGAVDLSLVNDARQREAMEAQIHHFGQTPSQVLKEPHPVRLPPEECVLPIFSPTSTVECLRVFSAGNRPPDPCRAAALLVYCTLDRLVSVDAALRVTTWTWSGVPDGFGLPFTLGSCKTNFLPSRSLHMSSVSARTSAPSGEVLKTRACPSDQDPSCPWPDTILTEGAEEADEITGPSSPASSGRRSDSEGFAASELPTWKDGTPAVPAPRLCRVHSCFGLCTASQGSFETILSCGYWDNVVRVHRVNSAVKLPLEGSGTGGHLGAISCLAIAQGSSLLVTGGQDATCRVWVVGNPAMAAALGGTSACSVNATMGTSSRDSMVCVHVLFGHEAPVTCLAVSEELDAVVSGSSDGRIVLHCLKDGSYVRQYRCGLSIAEHARGPIPASQLVFSCHGDVVAHSWADCSLHRFSLNGTRLATTVAPTAMNCLLTAGEGDYLLAGGQDGLIRVYTLHDLCVLHTIDLQHHGGVTCMRLSPNDEYLLVGSHDGEVSIITDARKRMRMLDLALRKAFVG